MPKLEAVLERRGIASAREMSEAVARQELHGGDLTTSLLQFVDADEAQLSAALSECHGLPAAVVGALPAPEGGASKALPRELAERYCCFPLESDPGRLVLAVAAPLEAGLKEELAFALGVQVEERVALEVRIRQAISRHYGLPLAPRNQRGIARLEGDGASEREAAHGPWPETQLESLPRPPSDRPPPAVMHSEQHPRHTLPARASSIPPSSGHRPSRRRGPLGREPAREELARATSRDEVLEIFFSFACQYFEYSALFAVHKNLAEGLDAWGPGADRDTVNGVGVPLDLPSSLSEAAESCKVRLTRLGRDGLDEKLAGDLRRTAGARVVLLPICLKGRCALLLYGDNGALDVAEKDIADVIALAPDVASALGRIIVLRKREAAARGMADPAEVSASLARGRLSSAPPPATPLSNGAGLAAPSTEAAANAAGRERLPSANPARSSTPSAAPLPRTNGAAREDAATEGRGERARSDRRALPMEPTAGTPPGSADATRDRAGEALLGDSDDDSEAHAPILLERPPLSTGDPVFLLARARPSAPPAEPTPAPPPPAAPAPSPTAASWPPTVAPAASALSPTPASSPPAPAPTAASSVPAPAPTAASSVPAPAPTAPSPPPTLAPTASSSPARGAPREVPKPPTTITRPARSSGLRPRLPSVIVNPDTAGPPPASVPESRTSAPATPAPVVPAETPARPEATSSALQAPASPSPPLAPSAPQSPRSGAVTTSQPPASVAPASLAGSVSSTPQASVNEGERPSPNDGVRPALDSLGAPIRGQAQRTIGPAKAAMTLPASRMGRSSSEQRAQRDTAALGGTSKQRARPTLARPSERKASLHSAPQRSAELAHKIPKPEPSAEPDKKASATGTSPGMPRPPVLAAAAVTRPAAPRKPAPAAGERAASRPSPTSEAPSLAPPHRPAMVPPPAASLAAPAPGDPASGTASLYARGHATLASAAPAGAGRASALPASSRSAAPVYSAPASVPTMGPAEPFAPSPSAPPPSVAPISSLPRPSLPADVAEANSEIERLVELACQGNARAAQDLARIGAPTLPQLMARFPGPVISERAGPNSRASECGPLLRALAHIGSPAMPDITRSSADRDARIRRWATLLLGELPSPESCRAVVQRLADEDPRVHQAALDAARLLLSSSAANLFRRTLFEIAEAEDAPLTLRLRTLEHVAKLKDSASVPRLIGFLTSDVEPIVHKALWALSVVTRQDFGRDIGRWWEFWHEHQAQHRLEWLIDALDHSDARLRRAAAEELELAAGDRFGYDSGLPPAERQDAQRRYRQWWESVGARRVGRLPRDVEP